MKRRKEEEKRNTKTKTSDSIFKQTRKRVEQNDNYVLKLTV